jgi:hypothetical protein
MNPSTTGLEAAPLGVALIKRAYPLGVPMIPFLLNTETMVDVGNKNRD